MSLGDSPIDTTRLISVGLAFALASTSSAEVQLFRGTSDASAAISLGKDLILVADDENNHLRSQNPTESSIPQKECGSWINRGSWVSSRRGVREILPKGLESIRTPIDAGLGLPSPCVFLISATPERHA
ncbi:MAG: hypothetical protein IIA65_06875 [Planctomycetes bacterium]|nr:hypothetical protein [Planctomycetota bacterium]